jgi:hypothetical protein
VGVVPRLAQQSVANGCNLSVLEKGDIGGGLANPLECEIYNS